MISDRILECLKDSPKTNRQLKELIPDKSMRCLSATISNNPSIFLRLDKAYVGLKGRDEHLITGNRIKPDELSLFKKIFNIASFGVVYLKELYEMLPNENKVSIRAVVCMNKHVFLKLDNGIFGLRNRDEHLIEKFERKKLPLLSYREKVPSISDRLVELLADGRVHSLNSIRNALIDCRYKSITCKLSLDKRFVRVGDGLWKLKI